MAHEVTVTNTISKQEVNGNLIYFFPRCTIHAFTDETPANEYYIQHQTNGLEIQRVNFDDITDKLQKANLTDYLDTCCTNGYWS